MRKFNKSLILMAVFSLFTCYSANAEIIIVDGKTLQNIQTIEENNRTLAPVRAIMESLGIIPEWNKNTRTITAKDGENIIKMEIGKKYISLNGITEPIDVAPKIFKDSTYIPVRAFSEMLGMEVIWNKEDKSINIRYKEIKLNPDITNITSTLKDDEISLTYQQEHYFLVDENGNEAVMGAFQNATTFYNGLARVKIGNLWGCINKDGKIIVPCQFNGLGQYNEKLIPYMNFDGSFGYIDGFGNIIIQAKYDYASKFENGKALVMKFVDPYMAKQNIELPVEVIDTLRQQAIEEINNQELYNINIEPITDTTYETFNKEMQIETQLLMLKESYKEQYLLEAKSEDPKMNLTDITNEHWMYIDNRGKVLENNVELTETQRNELLEQI